jgi:hypothetical protein
MAIELIVENERRRLAVAGPVGQTAVDEVAARHRTGGRILLRLILPLDLTGIVEVQGKDVVREGTIHVHDAVDNDRRAFVAVQEASREGPGHAELFHVLLVDLVHL